MSLRLGTKLGDRYVLVHPIARGGMGQVYEARDEKLGRRVAVKVLLDELARDPTCHERFRREAHAVASTSHPSLVAIYDLSLEGSPTYLVMELLEGASVSHLLASEGRIAWPRLMRWLTQVLDALACLHEHGITHRDLKPGNILITGAGERELAKVIDLGVAQLQTGSAYQRLTQSGAIVGTPAFMAPEQLSGERTGPSADLWAVGTIAYTCLTGQRPYPAKDMARLMESMLGQPPTPLRTLAPDVPEAVEQLVMQLLSKDAARRPSARMAADAMRGLTLGAPIDLMPSIEARSMVTAPSGPAAIARPLAVDPPVSRVELGPGTRAVLGAHARTSRMSTWAAVLAGVGVLTTCLVGALLAYAFAARGDGAAASPSMVPGLPAPRQLDVVHSGPDADAARRTLAPTLDPRLRSCIELARHGLGAPIAAYTVQLDAYGAPSGLRRISGAGTAEEYACIEATLMSAHWPPPSTSYMDATVILMPAY